MGLKRYENERAKAQCISALTAPSRASLLGIRGFAAPVGDGSGRRSSLASEEISGHGNALIEPQT